MTSSAVATAASGGMRNSFVQFSQSCVFGYWTVPSGVTNISFFLWGSSAFISSTGAYVEGRALVTPGELLRVTVGGDSSSTEECGYPGMGYGYSTTSGGGLSGIARLNAFSGAFDFIAVAGGAGGSSYGKPPFGEPGKAISPTGCGAFNPYGQDVSACWNDGAYWSSNVGGGRGGWQGGLCGRGQPGQSGSSCAPGAIDGTVISLPGVYGPGNGVTNANSPYFRFNNGDIMGGLVAIAWDAPVGTPSHTPSWTPTSTQSESLSGSPSRTASGTAGATPSISATASVSPYCNPSVYRTFEYSTFDGVRAAAPRLLQSERDCQRACCDVLSCQAYTFDSNTILLGGSWAPCYFLRNVTQIVPNPAFASGVKFANNS